MRQCVSLSIGPTGRNVNKFASSYNPFGSTKCMMETFSVLLAICAGNSPVTGEFPAQRPVTQSFDVFFVLCLNKRVNKQSWGWWFETPSHPLWRHCNGTWKYLLRNWFPFVQASMCYRYWYQYWGHCCLINDLRSSPQPKGYHDETKLMMNKQILWIQMFKIVPKLSVVTAWLHEHIFVSCDLIVYPWQHVQQPCDVTVRFVALNLHI